MPDRGFTGHLIRKRLVFALVALGLLWVAWDQSARRTPLHRAEWLQADDVQLRAVRAGVGDTTLLLLHGYGESLVGYRAIFDRLARHHRVIAVDLPGFGLSDKPAGPYDLPAMVRRLGDFLGRWTSGPIVVVGHSMGGEIAAALALELPDRVVAAVLLAPAGDGLGTVLGDTSSIASPGAAWFATALAFILPVHDPAWLWEPADRASYAPLGDPAYRAAARQVLEQFDFSALHDRFRELHQPTLLIWGREDPTIPYRIGELIGAMLPCRRMIVLPNTLHRPHQAQPDTVVAEMERFLQDPGSVCRQGAAISGQVEQSDSGQRGHSE